MMFPTKRIKIDGRWWRVQIRRPPSRETLDGLCDKSERTIYIHKDAVARRGIELAAHEVIHARLFDIDEEAVTEIGQVTQEVCQFLAKHNGGENSFKNIVDRISRRS